MRRPAARWLRGAEIVSLALGTACTLAVLGAAAMSLRAQRSTRDFKVRTVGAQGGIPQQDYLADGKASAHVMGRLEIPELKISVPILSDFDASSLIEGVGHVPGTAMPGGLGTLGLAGHRDTYFRPLKNIQHNMDIRVIDSTGVYHYSVDSTEVVTPEHVQVLDIRDRPELTLITCYPFSYIGAAPKRFIVHAHLVSALPDSR